MPCFWGNIYPKLTKKTNQPEYDSFVTAIQSLPEFKRQHTHVLSPANIKRYILRAGVPPCSKRAFAQPSPTPVIEEGSADDSDNGDNDDMVSIPSAESTPQALILLLLAHASTSPPFSYLPQRRSKVTNNKPALWPSFINHALASPPSGTVVVPSPTPKHRRSTIFMTSYSTL